MKPSQLILGVSSRLLRGHAGAHAALSRRFGSGGATRSFKPYRLKGPPAEGPLRVVHVNGNFAIGGTTQLIVDLIERIGGAYSHEVVVPEVPDPLPYQPVEVRPFSISAMQSLYHHLERTRPALVHVQYWVRAENQYDKTAVWYATVFRICEALGLPVLQNVNVPTSPFKSPAIVENTFVSRFVQTYYDTGCARTNVIYPGSNFDHFRQADNINLSNVVGMVYRLDQDKLNEQSIEVFIEAVRLRPQTRCLIVGGGHFYDRYRSRVAEEGMQESFEFTGFVSYASLPAYYARLGVFVTPVHDESFGQVTPFAMSMGLCVAGYDTGAISEILGGTDTLVAYGDVRGLAREIVALLEDPDRRLAIGATNRLRAHREFSVERMIDAYREVYARCSIDPRYGPPPDRSAVTATNS